MGCSGSAVEKCVASRRSRAVTFFQYGATVNGSNGGRVHYWRGSSPWEREGVDALRSDARSGELVADRRRILGLEAFKRCIDGARQSRRRAGRSQTAAYANAKRVVSGCYEPSSGFCIACASTTGSPDARMLPLRLRIRVSTDLDRRPRFKSPWVFTSRAATSKK